MSTKLKLGVYWAAGCGGCDIAILELHERLLELLELVEIVFWPCVMDFKYDDVRRMPDASMDLVLFNGALRTVEDHEVARMLRRKSKVMVAYGACAIMGGIPGLANLYALDEMLERIYLSSESTHNPSRVLPQRETTIDAGKTLTLTELQPSIVPLHQIVKVDYFLPGCPPESRQVGAVLELFGGGDLPPSGSVVGAGDRTVCDECRFEKRDMPLQAVKRPHQIRPDGQRCLLEQGIICLGPATRSGCEAQCLTANMPCRGCYGPPGDALDQGAKMIGVLGSIVEPTDRDAVERCVEAVEDPAGTFYRFGLPGSIMGRSRDKKGER